MFYLVEILDRILGKLAEKTAGTQTATQTTFNTAQAGRAHGRSSISSRLSPHRKTLGPGWRATIESKYLKLVAGQAAAPEGDIEVNARRLPFHLGQKLTACSIHARSADGGRRRAGKAADDWATLAAGRSERPARSNGGERRGGLWGRTETWSGIQFYSRYRLRWMTQSRPSQRCETAGHPQDHIP